MKMTGLFEHFFKRATKCAVFSLICAAALSGCRQNFYAGRPFAPDSRPTELPTEPKTTRAAQMISLETPLRCAAPDEETKLVTVMPFKQEAFSLRPTQQNGLLPTFMVDDYSFENKSADQIFYELLRDKNVKVIGIDGPFPELSAEGVSGEINDVVRMIADAADVYYRYDDKKRVLYVSRNIQWALTVPAAKEVMIAVLDSLRGSGMHDLNANWMENVITFKGDKETENKVRELIRLFDSEPKLMVFDVQVYRVRPFSTQGVQWQNLLSVFGMNSVKLTVSGVLGRGLVTGYKLNSATLPMFLKSQSRPEIVSEGMFIAASGWRARFDVGRCGRMNMPEAQLSVMTQSEIFDESSMSSLITLDSDKGEISAFNLKASLGDGLMIVGIPSSSFSSSLKEFETVVFMTPRFIRLVKETAE